MFPSVALATIISRFGFLAFTPEIIYPCGTVKRKQTVTIEQVKRAYATKGALVLRRCRMILRNDNDAEDMLHDTFHRILKYNVQIETDDISLSFLYRTAERCCFDLMGRRKRKRVQQTDNTVDDIPHPFTCDTYEISQLLNIYFETLDDKLKIISLMYYLDGMTQQEIANELGWSRRTVGKKLNLLRKKAEKLKNE